jgi:hypothetical protein
VTWCLLLHGEEEGEGKDLACEEIEEGAGEPGESRQQGGVNRANLKFINLSTTTSRVSVRNINESEREGEKQITSK